MKDVERLAQYQELLYVQNTWAMLVILQGMDSSGKDGIIKHVMSGLDPQGTQVTSFKSPSGQELDHDYLWRSVNALPARGNIGIFNRSYHEEVVVVRVHPALVDSQRLSRRPAGEKLWAERFEDINAFERYLTRNGTVVRKFFLHILKDEQTKRLLERIDRPDKQWKFSTGDTTQRAYWDEYTAPVRGRH
jgi:PPK2 family polyphosphate:nucleotide phosphotransferase